MRFKIREASGSSKVKKLLTCGYEKLFVMVNEAMSDSPRDTLTYSMRQELEQVNCFLKAFKE